MTSNYLELAGWRGSTAGSINGVIPASSNDSKQIVISASPAPAHDTATRHALSFLSKRAMRSRLLSLYFWPLVIFAAVTLVISVDSWLGYRHTIADATARAQTLARILDEHTARALESVDLLLLRVLDGWEPMGANDTTEDPNLSVWLRAQLPPMPHVRSVALVNAAGRPLADSAASADGWLLADGEYYFAHKDQQHRGLYISAPMRTVLTERRFIAVSRPMFLPGGVFAGLAVAYLEPEYFTDIYRSLDLGLSGSMSLYRADGVLLARNSADMAGVIGQSFARDPSFQAGAPTGEREQVGWITGADGDSRITARRVLADRPLVVTVGLASSDFLEEWRQRVATEAAIGLAFGALILAYATSSRRQLSQREEMAQALLVAKEQADAANQSKTRFLAHMSHELRTPLNTILGFAELMETTDADDPERIQRYREYCRDIRDSGEHLLHLIDDLLDLSKIEANRKSLTLEVTDLSIEIRRCVDMMMAQAMSAKIQMEVTLPPDLPFMEVDRRSFRQILLNLLSNAVKFTVGGGRVSLLMEFDDASVRLTVRDTGIGIPTDRIALLGRPFETLDDPLLHKPKGTGLGLALSTALVQLHGGTITIGSEIGVGTTVIVTLPRGKT